jgi:hypothetical protein
VKAASAYQLQHLYNGFEKIAGKSLAAKGVKLTVSAAYHKDLLVTYWEHFHFEQNEIDLMEDLRAFRHFARSAYGFDLEGIEVREKVAHVLAVWPGIKNKISDQMQLDQ